MSNVDFYLLEDPKLSKDRTACLLTEKAFHLGNRLYLHAKNEQHASIMDNLLWTFHDASFIPHVVFHSDQELAMGSDYPVLIGYKSDVLSQKNMNQLLRFDVVICLSILPISIIGQLKRTVEIVLGEDKAEKEQARQRYRQYRQAGFSLKHHSLN